MEIGTLLTGTKWEIMEALSEKPSSPAELSKKLDTTLANISVQLRLLETAGLIKTQKLHSHLPGKPRKLFSISEDYALITIISEGLAKKKLTKISKSQREVLKKIIR